MSTSYILLLIVGSIIISYLIIDAINDRNDLSIADYVLKAIKRAWIQHNINGWQRDIEQIQAQRTNDFRAENAIAREIINARAQLADLE